MSARDIVGGLAGAAVSAARKPLETTARAFGLAKGVASTGAAAAEGIAQHAVGRIRGHQGSPVRPVQQTQPVQESSPLTAVPDLDEPEATEPAAGPATATGPAAGPATATGPAKKAPAKKSAAAKKAAPAKKAAAKKTTAKQAPARPADDGPQVVLREPAPPEQPPIDVVGEALAAEAESPGGRAGEPRGASRDEEHGEASLQRAEVDEILDETEEGLPGGDVDVETPVGTTGAGVAYNPDTAESDLQQPQTEPLMDESLTKAVQSDQETGSKASTPTPES